MSSGRQTVDVVKAGQKANEAWKQKWITYTVQLDGIRDPNRHDDATLQSFIDMNMAEHQHEPWFSAALAGQMPASAPRGPPRAQMGGMGMGYTPMGKGGMGGGMGMQQPMVMHPSGPGASSMVEAIKTGQRQDSNFKESWWKFCDQYCEGIRDPNRHPVQNLELFLSENKPNVGGGMQMPMGGMGAGMAPSATPTMQTVMVSGVPAGSTVAIIADYFSQFGNLVGCELKVDGRGNPSGSAQVKLFPQEGAPQVQGMQHEILGTPVGTTVVASGNNPMAGYGAQRGGPYGKGY